MGFQDPWGELQDHTGEGLPKVPETLGLSPSGRRDAEPGAGVWPVWGQQGTPHHSANMS